MFYNKVLFVFLIIFEMYLYIKFFFLLYIMYSVIDIFMGNLVGLSEDKVWIGDWCFVFFVFFGRVNYILI